MRLGKYLSSLTKPELVLISENANFTTDEKIIFLMLAKNKSIVQISQEINVCTRTVNRKIVTIKEKIMRLEGYKNGGYDTKRKKS